MEGPVIDTHIHVTNTLLPGSPGKRAPDGTPFDGDPRALADAITRIGPAAVVLWSQIPDTGDPTQLTRVAAHPHLPMLLAAAGPGWPADLPTGVSRLTTLPEAVALLSA